MKFKDKLRNIVFVKIEWKWHKKIEDDHSKQAKCDRNIKEWRNL